MSRREKGKGEECGRHEPVTTNDEQSEREKNEPEVEEE
jgi:hypothetical protein